MTEEDHPQPVPQASRPGPVPGLVTERTTLAWSRSGLAAVGCLAVLARRLVPFDIRSDRIAEIVLLSTAAIIFAAAFAVSARRAEAGVARVDVQHRRLRLLTLSTTVIGMAAFLLGMFSRG